MPSGIIPGDGRIRIEVKVQNTKDITDKADKKRSHQKTLFADPGTTRTYINLQNVKDLGGTVGPIKGRSSIGGDFYEISGLSMEVEVEDDKGKKSPKTCDKMFAAEIKPEIVKDLADKGCVGFLGMDQFDALSADPVKNAEGTRAYLRLRTTDPPPEKK